MAASASESTAEPTITMCGPPSSGKTTFIAALHTALIRQDAGWRLYGADQFSADALVELTTRLTSQCKFPQATKDIEHYRWTLVGQYTRRVTRRWPWGRRLVERTARITLDLIDTAGELASPDAAGSPGRAELVRRLASSTGIVLCYDPIREFETGTSFDYALGLLAELSHELQDLPGARLPHYVAVCVTKFDDLRLVKTAEALRILEVDPDTPESSPRVPDEDAREFLDALGSVSRSGNSDLLVRLLDHTFYPDRVKYFVTSAVGFYVSPRRGFYDPDDPQNVIPGSAVSEPSRIRGSIHPINVVEPILWLGTRALDEQP
jgi:GTPase SAR1 family protein